MACASERFERNAPRKVLWKCLTPPSEQAACPCLTAEIIKPTETQAMVAKLPVLKGKTDTVTMMSYGFDPYRLPGSSLPRRNLCSGGIYGKGCCGRR